MGLKGVSFPSRRIAYSFGLLAALGVCVGCTRSFYRRSADREVYRSIAENADRLGVTELPAEVALTPGPESRLFDPFDPDHPPMPPDDPLSHELMVKVDGKRGARQWRKPGDAPVEDSAWLGALPRDKSGTVVLDLQTAMNAALRNSRDYQEEREDLYLSALDVTFERFQFSPQFALDATGRGQATGSKLAGTPKAIHQVSAITDGSVRWMTATGGELLAGFANTLVWNFNGDTSTYGAGSLLNFSIVQPLMRFGGRAYVLERLTESERRLLANVRQMEQFQSGFYVHIASGRTSGEGPTRTGNPGSGGLGVIAGTPSGRTGIPRADGFMGMLEEQQRIRNLEANVARLRASFDQLDAAFDAGRISSRLQVDQARQSLLNGQSSLLSSRAAYQTRLDSYKIELGLPPSLPLALRDTLLDRFATSDSGAVELDQRLGQIQVTVRDKQSMTKHEDLKRQIQVVYGLQQPLEWQIKAARHDVARLRQIIPTRREQLRSLRDRPEVEGLSLEPMRLDGAALDARVKQLEERIDHVSRELDKTYAQLREFEKGLLGLELDAARSQLSDTVSDLSGLLLALSLDQTATKLESASLPPIEIEEASAIAIAKENRLDWMNARARLVDSWRKVDYYSNRLMSGLTLTFDGNMGTLRDDSFRFDGRTGVLRMGLRFDTPLTRLAERNDYREALIEYQRARRDYMLFEDRVSQSIRNTLRMVQLSQLNFELRRAAVQVAISQVDLARLRLQEPPRPGAVAQFGATTARDLVSALNDLLDAQNDFLSLQVGYDVVRMLLDFELGTLRLNKDGLWQDPGNMNAKALASRVPQWKTVSTDNSMQKSPKQTARWELTKNDSITAR